MQLPRSVTAFFCTRISSTSSFRYSLHLTEKIYEKYGSIGASPYAVDIVSMTLETRHGVWVAEVPIKPKGISKKRRTFSAPEFRHFKEMAGRFSHLLPAKNAD